MKHTSPRAVALIGPGRIGQALGKLLSDAGVRIEWIAARRASAARQAARFIGSGEATSLDSFNVNAARVLLLTTSDSALPEVTLSLASQRADWKGSIVLHTSGALPAGGDDSVLAPFRRRGAAAASLHPLQTVPNREAGVRNLIGCTWAIEGDAQAAGLARRWVRLLRGTPFTLPSQQKAIYHAAAMISCAGVVALMESAERLMKSCGVPPSQVRKMLAGFVGETAASFGRLGAQRSLTGPVMRGDWSTIRKHQAALRRQAPDLLPIYRELLRSMLKIAGQDPKRRL